jgi:hypothetical protein
MIYSPRTAKLYRFTRQALNGYQMHYLRLIDKLTRQRQIPVALLRVPLWTERRDDAVTERLPWPEIFLSKLCSSPPARPVGCTLPQRL